MKNMLKKLLSGFLILAFSFSFLYIDSTTVVADTSWPSGPSVYAETAVVMDASTGTVLYDKKADKTMYPASITKILTALLTIENCEMDEVVVFSEYAINSLSYDDANIACQIGEEMTVKECLYALMLSSANEVATALGEHIAGSEEAFAEMMNARAKEAGALNCNFKNANGLHNPDHYVTAYDMAMITRAAAEYPVFNDIVNSTAYTIKKNNKREESFTAYQRHKMVWPTSGYYYDGIIGGKTGYTDQSGTTLVTYVEKNGMTLICVVLKSNGTNVYSDTTSLLDFGFNNFSLVNPSKKVSAFNTDSSLGLTSPFIDSTKSIGLDKNSAVILPKNIDFSELTSSVEFSLSENSFGTVTYTYGDKTVGQAKLVFTESSTNTEEVTSVETTSTEETTNELETTDEDKPVSQTVSNPPKKSTLGTVVIIIAIVLVLLIIIMIYKRRLERIRARKRHRRR